MECVPCGDPPPPYEPHCKCWFCFRVFSLLTLKPGKKKKRTNGHSYKLFLKLIFLLVNDFVSTFEQIQCYH